MRSALPNQSGAFARRGYARLAGGSQQGGRRLAKGLSEALLHSASPHSGSYCPVINQPLPPRPGPGRCSVHTPHSALSAPTRPAPPRPGPTRRQRCIAVPELRQAPPGSARHPPRFLDPAGQRATRSCKNLGRQQKRHSRALRPTPPPQGDRRHPNSPPVMKHPRIYSRKG